MNFHVKYRPLTLKDFVGQRAVKIAIGLLRHKPMHVSLIAPYGCGKTSLSRLLGKGHFCVEPIEGPCGRCANCLRFEENWESGFDWFDQTDGHTAWYQGYDFTRIGIEGMELIRHAVAGRIGAYHLMRDFPAVLIFDEIQRASAACQDRLLKPLENPSAASLIFCIPQSDVGRIGQAFGQRLHPFVVGKPDVVELCAWIKKIAAAERIVVEEEPILEELVMVCERTPRIILTALEMIVVDGGVLSWTELKEIKLRIRIMGDAT